MGHLLFPQDAMKPDQGKEDYEELKECLGETFKEIEVVKSEGLEIDGEPFDVEWYCRSDWKFLALVYGLNAACSKLFCIWCFCTKDNINDLDVEEWPIETDLADCERLAKKSTTDGY